MGRYRTSAKKQARQDRESQPSFTVNTLQMRPFAPPQESQAQPQAEEQTAELGHRLENISFQPRPQVDIMARKWEGIRAAYQAKQVQAKLAIGAVGDKYEQEADQVASQVVQTINTPENVQREDEEQVQTKPLESIQREEAPEEEDETLQMKPLSNSIQREEAPEEEEELQMKPLSNSISIQRVMDFSSTDLGGKRSKSAKVAKFFGKESTFNKIRALLKKYEMSDNANQQYSIMMQLKPLVMSWLSKHPIKTKNDKVKKDSLLSLLKAIITEIKNVESKNKNLTEDQNSVSSESSVSSSSVSTAPANAIEQEKVTLDNIASNNLNENVDEGDEDSSTLQDEVPVPYLTNANDRYPVNNNNEGLRGEEVPVPYLTNANDRYPVNNNNEGLRGEEVPVP
ncbi:hypothetical protein V2H45_18650, partial [Tumidithrix elongata RA019]|nr:hypothetical protein [Tumidithrix elongata RA019]